MDDPWFTMAAIEERNQVLQLSVKVNAYEDTPLFTMHQGSQ